MNKLQFSLLVKPAERTEIITGRMASVALGAFPNRHHLVSVTVAKAAVDGHLSVTLRTIDGAFFRECVLWNCRD
jgi:hypothetical protein